MSSRLMWRRGSIGVLVAMALGVGCVEDVCGCSWTSGALAYGSVVAAGDGTPVAGAAVRFTVYDGGQAGSLCAGGRYPQQAQGEAVTDEAGRFRHPLRIGMATPAAACVVATARPPEASVGLVAASVAGGPVRFRVCGADPCTADSVAIAVVLPRANP